MAWGLDFRRSTLRVEGSENVAGWLMADLESPIINPH